ncbi:MAG: glycosyl hydrolase family 8, partial [Minisyncoccia bacterium]
MAVRIAGYGLLGAAVVLFGFVLYRNSWQSSHQTIIFSPSQTLAALWNDYKASDLESGTGRTLDASRNDVTTSEGQSYTMLRAVWMGDKSTFDKEWQWTQTNLARKDGLFSWLWGERQDGSYGILTDQNGQNSASDADTNIALSLVFAYARWQDPKYLSAARTIIDGIWNNEVLTAGGNSYVLADNLEKNSQGRTALINPSYLSPAAYRIFAEVDPAHPWMQAVNGAYRVIQGSSAATLGATSSADLPP